MPVPRTDVDREAARVLCVAVGVREAARQMGIPEATMQAWSARGQWSASIRTAQDVVRQKSDNQLQPTATKPADALAKRLADHSSKTRLGLSKAALSAAKTFAKKTGDQVIEHSQELRHVVAAASTLHGWEERKEAGLTLNLGIVQGGMS